jgi:hypothetical protein
MVTLKVKDCFKTWIEFEQKLTEWRDINKQPLFLHKASKRIQKYNEDHPTLPPLSEYFSVNIQCAHSGKWDSKAKTVNITIFKMFPIFSAI